jgi:hypothetical protein
MAEREDSNARQAFRIRNIQGFDCRGRHICHICRAALHRLHRATSIPFQAAKAHWEPFPNLRGFVADEDKEFQASLARDRAENL